MRIMIASAMAVAMLTGCTDYGSDGRVRSDWRRYDYNRPDPNYGGYYADRYYREDRRYTERRLSRNDRIYRGQDGRYYCRRNDGTTGLVVGAIAGGILGNLIAPADQRHWAQYWVPVPVPWRAAKSIATLAAAKPVIEYRPSFLRFGGGRAGDT